MKIIYHRRNTINALLNTSTHFGVEVDIRSHGKDLIIHHDPYVIGEFFELWIEKYNHQTLILNVKEEGLESRLISIMKEKKIEDYFFLDQSFPYLVKTSNLGENRCAVRISEFESIETALSLQGKVNWIWADSFKNFNLTYENVIRLKNAGFKICIASPELQGRSGEKEIPEFYRELKKQNITVNAVCTKMPNLWLSLYTTI